jgi:hypothetical protein
MWWKKIGRNFVIENTKVRRNGRLLLAAVKRGHKSHARTRKTPKVSRWRITPKTNMTPSRRSRNISSFASWLPIL